MLTKKPKKKNEWIDEFDVIIVGSCKPKYMLDPRLSLFRVNPVDGSLLNTDGLYEIKALEPNGADKFLSAGKVFQGGNWKHLQAMLEIEAGEEILYVGDHLYADVLRSKRTLGWRSAFIMPELEEELRVFSKNAPILSSISQLRRLRDELSIFSDSIKKEKNEDFSRKLKEIEEDDSLIKDKLRCLNNNYHNTFHPVWGAMFVAGYQDSRFAFFVQNYACLYTSKATNLGLSSAARAFRTMSEMLPHGKLIADCTTVYKENTSSNDETK
mmetsp:Transcript_31384/g.34738  ORF Transcript_31384/g.34738 Transcript_31384/m.34738 type:complete len:269 (+) Transcript_31384:1051-1857(+)